jgi:hypothetical protein
MITKTLNMLRAGDKFYIQSNSGWNPTFWRSSWIINFKGPSYASARPCNHQAIRLDKEYGLASSFRLELFHTVDCENCYKDVSNANLKMISIL